MSRWRSSPTTAPPASTPDPAAGGPGRPGIPGCPGSRPSAAPAVADPPGGRRRLEAHRSHPAAAGRAVRRHPEIRGEVEMALLARYRPPLRRLLLPPRRSAREAGGRGGSLSPRGFGRGRGGPSSPATVPSASTPDFAGGARRGGGRVRIVPENLAAGGAVDRGRSHAGTGDGAPAAVLPGARAPGRVRPPAAAGPRREAKRREEKRLPGLTGGRRRGSGAALSGGLPGKPGSDGGRPKRQRPSRRPPPGPRPRPSARLRDLTPPTKKPPSGCRDWGWVGLGCDSPRTSRTPGERR